MYARWTGEVKWVKCPSVTTGGKPYFYTGLTENGQRVWVVWGRVKQCWVIRNRDNEIRSGFTDAKSAMDLFKKEAIYA